MSVFPAESYNNFWMLWESSNSLLFKKCLLLMDGDVCAAEDALSTAMLKAREKMVTYGDRVYNFQAWALKLTENVCLDQLRRQKRLVNYDNVAESLLQQDFFDSHLQMEACERYQCEEALLHEVVSCICELPKGVRETALLKFLFSMRYREIAGRLQITEMNARKRIQKARAILQARLGEKGRVLLASAETLETALESSVLTKMRQQAAADLNLIDSEVRFCCKTAWVVSTPHSDRGKCEVLVLLPFKPGWNGRAFGALLQYLSLHPEGWKRRLELAQMLCVAGAWDQADKEIRGVLEKRPHSSFTRLMLGNMLLNLGRDNEAAVLFEESASLVYSESSRHYFAGMAAMSRDRNIEAMASFEMASKMEPSNAVFSQAKGLCLYRSKQYREALWHFEGLLRVNGADVVSLAHCCEISMLLNRQSQARQYADLILARNPHDLFALRRKSELSGPGSLDQSGCLKRYERNTELLQLFARIVKAPGDIPVGTGMTDGAQGGTGVISSRRATATM